MLGSRNKIIIGAVIWTLSLSYTSLLFAQATPDTRSPLIELEAIAESQADVRQVFTAQVVDNRTLKDVTLYHRREGQQAYTPLLMMPIGETAYFSASLPTDPSDLRSIQYYIQARDEGGNRTVEGYAFDPYTRELLSAKSIEITTTDVKEAPATPKETTGVRWWHIALGAIVVGAVAAASSGGDSDTNNNETGNSGTSTGTGTVPLTVTVTGI